ncbi:MAG: tetratricopeptide repeat protein [Bacteroidota bacterium]
MRNFIANFLFCFMILVPCFSKAQQKTVGSGLNPTIDSLQNFLKISKEDTSKVNTLNMLCRQFINMGNYKQGMQYAEQSQHIARNLSYQKGMAVSYHNVGIIYWYQGDYEKALDYNLKSLKIQIEIGDKLGISGSYNNIGLIYTNQGNYEKALNNYLKSLKISGEIEDKQGMATAYGNIGNIYYYQGNYDKVLSNYLKALNIVEKIGDKQGIGYCYNAIGLVYFVKDSCEKSLDYHLKALKARQEIGNQQGIASSYNNIGNVYEKQKNYEKSLENYLKSLKIKEKIGDKQGIAVSYNDIGSIYMNQNKLEESNYYFTQSLILSKEVGAKEDIKNAYVSLSGLSDKKGDYKQAYIYHKLYSNIKDTLLNEQSSKQIAEMNTKYDSEKKDKDLIKKDAEISKQQAETEKQNLQRNAFLIGFVLVIVLSFFIYGGYHQKKSVNKLLGEKNLMIEKQKILVEEKNEKITDSINYAKRIQQAVLPSDVLIKSFLPGSFIFFRPKDIVSGDFYWFSEKKDKLLIAVADCTGHGVPGAFMSMIGNTLLNEIVNVKNIVEPEQILDRLNKGIVSLLHQGEEATTQDDGMDITILSIDRGNNEIEFAGANHFSYLFHQNRLETLKGDVFSIGGMFGRSDINFTSKKIKVVEGNTVYLFTDGFIDQFGGEKNTKFLSGRFEQLLQSIQQYDIEQQQEKVKTAFDNWKGINKQLDDVLIVGIRL